MGFTKQDQLLKAGAESRFDLMVGIVVSYIHPQGYNQHKLEHPQHMAILDTIHWEPGDDFEACVRKAPFVVVEMLLDAIADMRGGEDGGPICFGIHDVEDDDAGIIGSWPIKHPNEHGELN